MPEFTPAVPERKSPLRHANDQLTEGETEETKPVSVIPWFFIILGAIAIALMVVFLVSNH